MYTEHKVVHCSRELAISCINSGVFKTAGYDLISISDTWREQNEMYKLWLGNKCHENAGLFLKFNDIPGIESGFSYLDANKIIRFSEESMRKNKNIIVHCYVGISRSAAVAKFINEYHNLNIESLDDYRLHNRWIYYTLLEEAGVPTLRQFYKEQENDYESR